LGSVQRILEAHQLALKRVGSFNCRTTRSSPRNKDVVGLYVDPPDHAVVLSVDEKAKPSGHDTPLGGFDCQIGKRPRNAHSAAQFSKQMMVL
jgi:hypothetical protein